ncbi:hypothetical protein KR51_00010000 [Rubidibacter lacunae KORDI 51-2]|uniref:HPr domain-containing protein n=1 Tax=Rubidibacter lacunae KORDI 51-2 TaxID=582515 RepID=U5DNZ5_9CHRO|nr:hypothetical protein [Rubidibacter lacunae]ERN42329.1 hypothetical protein KR51_00010000 [Rubidibacter lacunae KORDI 51-2]
MLQLEIEGAGAAVAAQALTELEGFDAGWESLGDDGMTRRDPMTVMAALATIVGLVGGTLEIAERLIAWYRHFKQKAPSDKTIDKVIVQIGARRIDLENTTVAQLKTILDSLDF